jgi:hypothetical protein
MKVPRKSTFLLFRVTPNEVRYFKVKRSLFFPTTVIALWVFAFGCEGKPREHEGNSQAGDPAVFAFVKEQKAVHKKPKQLTYGYRFLSDYSHEIELLKSQDLFKAGDAVILPVRLMNTGSETWPAKRPILPMRVDESRFVKFGHYAVTVGFRWFDLNGKMLNGVNYFLPHDVRPGESMTIDLILEVPITPGSYKLVIFLSQNNRKFYDYGNTPIVLHPNVEQ